MAIMDLEEEWIDAYGRKCVYKYGKVFANYVFYVRFKFTNGVVTSRSFSTNGDEWTFSKGKFIEDNNIIFDKNFSNFKNFK